MLRGFRPDHGSLINIGFAFNPLNLLPMLIVTVVIATLATVIPALSGTATGGGNTPLRVSRVGH